METVYIAHPISGDVEGNIKKVIDIIRDINLKEPDVHPIAPYIVDLYALRDDIPEERERGFKNTLNILKLGFISEIRLYGDRISSGMQREVEVAKQYGINISPMSDGTIDDFLTQGDYILKQPTDD